MVVFLRILKFFMVRKTNSSFFKADSRLALKKPGNSKFLKNDDFMKILDSGKVRNPYYVVTELRLFIKNYENFMIFDHRPGAGSFFFVRF